MIDLRHMKDTIMNLVYRAKWFIQRGKTGYAPIDKWSGHDYLANVIILLIEDLIENGSGYPFGFDSRDEWNEELGKILSGFYAWQLYIEDSWFDESHTDQQRRKACSKAYKEMQKSLEKSCKLLAKHFGNLWD